MSAAPSWPLDVLSLDEIEPLKCLHCCRPEPMCICLEFCEVCAELGEVCDDCWDSGRTGE